MEILHRLAEAVQRQDPWHIFCLIVDISLVVFFIWRAFLILRGTKGVAFLNVLGALLLLQVIGGYLPLDLFNKLVGLLGPMLLVAFPVIFQAELRRALEQLGRRNPLSRLLLGSHPEQARFITTIVQAAASMGENRVGGLIVIERDQDLGEIATLGVRLDATISKELIEQLFATQGPLHDGAVLIKGQRILAAGCLLPLSERHDLPATIGTRHRAGLGMAEDSDAVVIIVSEERGTMTLAVDGHLEMALKPETLSMRLAELLLGREDGKMVKRELRGRKRSRRAVAT